MDGNRYHVTRENRITSHGDQSVISSARMTLNWPLEPINSDHILAFFISVVDTSTPLIRVGDLRHSMCVNSPVPHPTSINRNNGNDVCRMISGMCCTTFTIVSRNHSPILVGFL